MGPHVALMHYTSVAFSCFCMQAPIPWIQWGVGKCKYTMYGVSLLGTMLIVKHVKNTQKVA